MRIITTNQALFPDLPSGINPATLEKAYTNKMLVLPPHERVIFMPPYTTVKWMDGTTTTVRCYDDEFHEEFGYAMAVMRKLYGDRKTFKAQFKDAYRPASKKMKKKKTNPSGAEKDFAKSVDAALEEEPGDQG